MSTRFATDPEPGGGVPPGMPPPVMPPSPGLLPETVDLPPTQPVEPIREPGKELPIQTIQACGPADKGWGSTH